MTYIKIPSTVADNIGLYCGAVFNEMTEQITPGSVTSKLHSNPVITNPDKANSSLKQIFGEKIKSNQNIIFPDIMNPACNKFFDLLN